VDQLIDERNNAEAILTATIARIVKRFRLAGRHLQSDFDRLELRLEGALPAGLFPSASRARDVVEAIMSEEPTPFFFGIDGRREEALTLAIVAAALLSIACRPSQALEALDVCMDQIRLPTHSRTPEWRDRYCDEDELDEQRKTERLRNIGLSVEEE
jgi:hypothetical protein